MAQEVSATQPLRATGEKGATLLALKSKMQLLVNELESAREEVQNKQSKGEAELLRANTVCAQR